MVHIIRTGEAEKKGQLQRGWLFHRSEGLQEVQLECYQINATLGNWLFAWCWDFPHLVTTSVNSWTSLAGWRANGHGNDNCTSWRINLWAKQASQSWNLEAWHLGEPSDSGTYPEARTLDKSPQSKHIITIWKWTCTKSFACKLSKYQSKQSTRFCYWWELVLRTAPEKLRSRSRQKCNVQRTGRLYRLYLWKLQTLSC